MNRRKKDWLFPLVITLLLTIISLGQFYNQYQNDLQNKNIEILQQEKKEDIISKTKMVKDIEYIKEKITIIFKLLNEKSLAGGYYGL